MIKNKESKRKDKFHNSVVRELSPNPDIAKDLKPLICECCDSIRKF